MRRRFGFILPIIALALMAQIFAPIGACWARTAAIGDPLHAAEMCLGGPDRSDQDAGSQIAAHDRCAACALAHAPAIPPDPQTYVVAPSLEAREIAWCPTDDHCALQQRDRNAQARAPPRLS